MTHQVKIKDMEIDYTVSHRDIKFPRLEFKTGELLLVLPKDYENPEELIEKKKSWIYSKKTLIDSTLKESKKMRLIDRSDSELKKIAQRLFEKLTKDSKDQVNRIFFRSMTSKWASLSKRKNLTLNTLLKYLPEPLIEYVIYHEITHLTEKKHNERYWKIISKRYPDYQNKEEGLFKYWFLVQEQLSGL
jgi:predicted metal-dependent hydrolase